MASLVLLPIAIVIGTGARKHTEPETMTSTLTSRDGQPDAELDALASLAGDPAARSGERPVYRYSVVPGGTYSGDELASAIENDAVVAAHYKAVEQSRLRTEVVPRDRYVHVSYRKGNDVFWTKKKVLLRKGETIVTDGTTQIRARCGNCISEQPLSPTANDEPEIVEFDRLVTDTPSQRAAVPGTFPPSANPAPDAVIPGVAPLAPLAGGFSSRSAPAGVSAAAPPTGGSVADPLAHATRAGSHEPGSPAGDDSPSPNGGDSPSPDRGNTPSPDPIINLPSLDDLPMPGDDSTPLIDDDPLPPGLLDPPGPTVNNQPDVPSPGGTPVNPVPVPEPGTFLLVGGGVAALVRKLRARAR